MASLLTPGFGVELATSLIGKSSMGWLADALCKEFGFVNKGYIRSYKPLPSVENWEPNSLAIMKYYTLFTLNSIPTYQERNRKGIKYLHDCTGTKVTVIAHSMGGLVTPDDDTTIDTIIEMGTPNQGVTAASLDDVAGLASELKSREKSMAVVATTKLKRLLYLDFNIFPEGPDFIRGSDFIRAHIANPLSPNIDYYILAGTQFSGTDGMIQASTTRRGNIEPIQVNENHASLLYPSGASWRIIKEIITQT